MAAGLSVKFYAASHGISLQAKGHVDGLMILVNTCIVELLSSSITRQEYESALYALPLNINVSAINRKFTNYFQVYLTTCFRVAITHWINWRQ